MMARHVYHIVCFEVDAAVTTAGCTPIEVETASMVVESETPQDAVMAWGDQLEAEEAS